MEEIELHYSKKYSNFRSVVSYFSEKKFFGSQLNALIEDYPNLNKGNYSVIDIGCGYGVKSYLLAENFSNVVGVDFIENIIKVNTLLNDRENLNFYTENFTSLKIVENRFNIATLFGFSLLNTTNTDDYINVLLKIKKEYLVPDGKIIIWSSSNYRGEFENGWYNHSKRELSEIIFKIKSQLGCKAELFEPFRKNLWKKFNLKNIYRAILLKQYYFIIIYHEI